MCPKVCIDLKNLAIDELPRPIANILAEIKEKKANLTLGLTASRHLHVPHDHWSEAPRHDHYRDSYQK